jgi:carboxyl-terminal processing protease
LADHQFVESHRQGVRKPVLSIFRSKVAVTVWLRTAALALTALIVQSAGIVAHQKTNQEQSLGIGKTATDLSRDLRRRSFEIVWTTVHEKHFDPSFGGVDWVGVKEKYEPRLASVNSDKEFYNLLQQMLGELRQSHFAIFPPEAVVDEDSNESSAGSVGLGVRLIAGQIVVTRVDQESPAEQAGIRPGYVITRIHNTAADEVIKASENSKDTRNISVRVVRSIAARMAGEPGTGVRVEYLDWNNRSSYAVLKRVRLVGEMSPKFGNFPPQYMEFESERLPGDIGYIRFNVFVTSLMPRIRTAIRSLGDADGVIIDLRGNPGGLGGMAGGIAGLLTDKQFSLGAMRLRAARQNFVAFPQEKAYLGPVVVLIDGLSASTSEILAAGLQEAGRAVVVGEPSAGAALPSIFTKLPTGALFQYAVADYRTPKGVLVEGRGVTPDVQARLTRIGLIKGRDQQLEAAIRVIRQAHGRTKRAA